MLKTAAVCLTSVIVSAVAAGAQGAEGPSMAGLVLWVDAANPASAVVGADGRVGQWKDLSGNGNDLKADGPGTMPELVTQAFNGKSAVRFSGGQSFSLTKSIREKAGSGTILVVWQRSAAQATGDKWQRIISSRADAAKPDNQAPNFCMTGNREGEPTAVEATIYDHEAIDYRPLRSYVRL